MHSLTPYYVLHTVTLTDANTLTNTILCALRAARKEESKKVSADISCCNVTYYNKPHSLIRHTVVSIQFSDQVSPLCVFHSPTPTMPLRRSRVQSCQPFQTSRTLLCRSPSVGTRWLGGWLCMCVCLRHLVKVGGSIGSNHIVFAMTAIMHSLLWDFVISYSTYHSPSFLSGGWRRGGGLNLYYPTSPP